MQSTPIPLLDRPPGRVRELLASSAPAYLLVNPVEYHGPHLSPHNDTLISRGLMATLHRGLSRQNPGRPLLFAGELEMGLDATPGPTTREVPYPLLCQHIERACAGLAELGARAVVLLTFHGGPRHALALQRGVELLRRRGVPAISPFNALAQRLLHLDPAELEPVYACIADPAERAAARALGGRDSHAGFLETSLSLHFCPRSVRGHREVPPCPTPRPDPKLGALARGLRALGRRTLAGELEQMAWAFGWCDLRPFPGYTGAPHLASAEAGEALAGIIGEQLVPLVEEVLRGEAEPPAPVLSWLAPLSLGGRINPTLVPAEAWPR